MSSMAGYLTRRIEESRRDPDRAAVVVEFALVVPILVLFLLGIIEFGYGFRQKLYVERADHAAGRVAASAGRDRLADYDALRAIDSSMGGARGVTLQRVIIWKAPNANADVPDSCMNQPYTGLTVKGVGGLCNVYSPEQVATSTTEGFRGPASGACAAGSWDSRWCPTVRDNDAPGVDFVGVYVEYRYDTLTNLLPTDSLSFTAKTVYQLEPDYVGRDD